MRFLLSVLLFAGLAAGADTPGRCAAAKAFAPGAGDWNGWGVDSSNSAFNPNPALPRPMCPS